MTTSTTFARPQIIRSVNGATHPTGSEQLVKSRHRVKTYGEVFTPSDMVRQMLDLVSTELETGPGFVDKTFFEPAAGDGNFLVAILHRKLQAIKRSYPPESWRTESLFALASIYGVELQHDNHKAAKKTLLAKFVLFHNENGTLCSYRTNLWRAARHLIDVNIRQGDTLNGLDAMGKLIEFSWWQRVPDRADTVQRKPFTLNSLRGSQQIAFDLTIYRSYMPCRIDHIHKGVKAGA